MACPSVSFTDVDDVLYARLLQQAVRAGAKFSQEDPQSMEISGCSISWTRTATTLILTCTKKPFFVSCDEVNSRLTDLINQAKEAA
jgi:hypothetical protein